MTRYLMPRSWAWSPDALFHELDDAFARSSVPSQSTRPAVETVVRGDEAIIRCDLPGVDPKQVEVTLLGDTLTIRGERRDERSREEKARYVVRELSYGSFERSFRVPDGIDGAKVQARYANGVLEVVVPLPSRATSRKIPVATETDPKPESPARAA